MKNFLFPGAVVVLLLGAIWLYARPQPPHQVAPPKTSANTTLGTLPPEATPLATSVTGATPQTAAPAHSIGTVTLSPPSISAGSTQPIRIAAQFSDPALIKTSVNLLQVMPTGVVVVIGQLNDNGNQGDLVPNDNIYSIVQAFPSLPVGTVTFRISAAFLGSLTRVQSPNLSLIVSQRPSTTGWTVLTDSHKLFSISVPPQWGLSTSDVANSDPDTLDSIIFSFPNGAAAFVITEHMTAGWADLQSNGFTAPDELGQNAGYVFGWSEPPDQISAPGFTDAQIRSQFDAIRATFHTP